MSKEQKKKFDAATEKKKAAPIVVEKSHTSRLMEQLDDLTKEF
jgi:hypothetical protein